MNTVLNRESIQTKRDLQRRIEDYVIQYCEALEENFKQHSINSYKRNIESPTSVTVGYTSYYEEQLQKIEDGTANLYKFDYQVGKKYIKVFNLQYSEASDYYNRPAGYRQGSVTAFIDKNTGEVYKPASWKAPAAYRSLSSSDTLSSGSQKLRTSENSGGGCSLRYSSCS